MRAMLAENLVAGVTNAEGGVDKVEGRDAYLGRIEAMDLPSARFSVELTQPAVAVDPDRVLVMVEIHAERGGEPRTTCEYERRSGGGAAAGGFAARRRGRYSGLTERLRESAHPNNEVSDLAISDLDQLLSQLLVRLRGIPDDDEAILKLVPSLALPSCHGIYLIPARGWARAALAGSILILSHSPRRRQRP